jgi:hypothetical protein
MEKTKYVFIDNDETTPKMKMMKFAINSSLRKNPTKNTIEDFKKGFRKMSPRY